MGAVESRANQRISPIFIAIVALTIIFGLIAWRFEGTATSGARMSVFAFVVCGWIVSLCLHEFGHALLAHRFGDRSISSSGYLTLDPRKYADLTLSLVLPVLFLLIGGIGLPGGAVWIDRGAISGKWRHSLVSAAGPIMNLIFAGVIGIALMTVGPGMSVFAFIQSGHQLFWAGLAFLGFLQVTAAVLNLLPVPGLDGFGIWEPYLPRELVRKVAPLGGYIFLGLIALLWIPAINEQFFKLVYHFTGWFGINDGLSALGHRLFMFWKQM
ncbi:site-2 protease family protein [Actinocorallia longicatena]|uniref:Site-2 protease family protein n=1 Tax=Actinocorallia longicatena TaxID=111803 RepID=A0ABP6QJN5_9ACTN